jgi:hypothetical protein
MIRRTQLKEMKLRITMIRRRQLTGANKVQIHVKPFQH